MEQAIRNEILKSYHITSTAYNKESNFEIAFI